MSEQKLKDFLEKHYKWLKNEIGGGRANLHSTNLRAADLSHSIDLLTFQFQRHIAFYTLDGSLTIGCLTLPITEWAETFEEIGQNAGYCPEQIKAYGQFIKLCLRMFKEA